LPKMKAGDLVGERRDVVEASGEGGGDAGVRRGSAAGSSTQADLDNAQLCGALSVRLWRELCDVLG
jgi:hypothetical protein